MTHEEGTLLGDDDGTGPTPITPTSMMLEAIGQKSSLGSWSFNFDDDSQALAACIRVGTGNPVSFPLSPTDLKAIQTWIAQIATRMKVSNKTPLRPIEAPVPFGKP